MRSGMKGESCVIEDMRDKGVRRDRDGWRRPCLTLLEQTSTLLERVKTEKKKQHLTKRNIPLNEIFINDGKYPYVSVDEEKKNPCDRGFLVDEDSLLMGTLFILKIKLPR
uniref:Uncharacterized protein n=1 Tax=Cacopsylla melanoneura TaxID=428564 RepID=A0A8D9F9K2_9HEMI